MYLNSFYVQKSKLMLYPLLEFAYEDIRPKQTYIAYKDECLLEEPSIVCAYERKNDELYYNFRNNIAFRNQYFVKYIIGLEYDYLIFSLINYELDYNNFLKGEYSKFEDETKQIILDSYSKTKIGPILVDTHLNPKNYHSFYAMEFNASIDALELAHETLSPPDIEKESIN